LQEKRETNVATDYHLLTANSKLKEAHSVSFENI
jgi:hypothetical protein